jgi:YVTN family beta-propeller protein
MQALFLALILTIMFSVLVGHLFVRVDAGSIPIPVGAVPVGIAYNPDNGDIYVTNAGSHSLSVISGETNNLVATILVGRIPYAVAYDPVNNHLYVANLGANTVSVINVATKSVITTIPVGKQPSSIIYDPTNHNVYVVNYGSKNISVINGSNKVVTNISVSTNPIDIAYNQDNGGIYVANAGANNVSVINSATNNLITNIPVGKNPTAVAYNPANNKIYVANKESGTISVIDGVTNIVSKTINVEPLPLGLAVNLNTNKIYVTHTKSNSTEKTNVHSSNLTTVINGYDDKQNPITLKSRPERAVVSLRNNLIYVTNPDSNYVSVIDGNTNQLKETPLELPTITKLIGILYLVAVILVPVVVIVLLAPKRTRTSIRVRLNNFYNRLQHSIVITRFLNFIPKAWHLSGVTLTLLSLIIMPVIVVLSQIFYDYMTSFFLTYYQYNEFGYEKTVSGLINLFIQGAFVAILFLYPPYPAPYSSRKYFGDRGFSTAVIEFELVKKILFITVPLFIVLTVLTNIPSTQEQLELPVKNYLSISLKVILQQPAFRISQGITFFIVFAGLLKLIFALSRKKFRLYYAKGCFEIWKNNRGKKDEVQSMRYVIKGLNSYNMYLNRHLKLHISEMRLIYSNMSRLSLVMKNQVLERLSNLFLQNGWETNTLRPVRFLYDFYTSEAKPKVKEEAKPKVKEEAKPKVKEEAFLIQQPFFDKVKNWSAFAAVLVPLVIAIIDLYLKFPK